MLLTNVTRNKKEKERSFCGAFAGDSQSFDIAQDEGNSAKHITLRRTNAYCSGHKLQMWMRCTSSALPNRRPQYSVILRNIATPQARIIPGENKWKRYTEMKIAAKDTKQGS